MENSTPPFRQRASAEERRRLISLFRASGLTQAAFAQQHNLKLGTFQQWIYRGQGKKGKKFSPNLFHELPVSALLSSPWAAEIAFPGGIKPPRTNINFIISWCLKKDPGLGRNGCNGFREIVSG